MADSHIPANSAVVRALYDASARGDIDSVLALVHPDCEWVETEVPGLPFSGTHHGHEELKQNVYGTVGAAFEDFAIEVEQILEAEHDNVVATGRVRGRARGGGDLNARFAHLFTLQDRKIKRLVNYHDTALWLAALKGDR